MGALVVISGPTLPTQSPNPTHSSTNLAAFPFAAALSFRRSRRREIVARHALRQQRLCREQGADDRSRSVPSLLTSLWLSLSPRCPFPCPPITRPGSNTDPEFSPLRHLFQGKGLRVSRKGSVVRVGGRGRGGGVHPSSVSAGRRLGLQTHPPSSQSPPTPLLMRPFPRWIIQTLLVGHGGEEASSGGKTETAFLSRKD